MANRVPLLNLAQPVLSFNITVNKPGQYVVVINYVTPKDDKRTHKVDAVVQSGRHTTNGKAMLYLCPYSTLCRQIITTPEGIVAVQQVDGNEIKIDLHVSQYVTVARMMQGRFSELQRKCRCTLDCSHSVRRLVSGLY